MGRQKNWPNKKGSRLTSSLSTIKINHRIYTGKQPKPYENSQNKTATICNNLFLLNHPVT